MKSPWVCTGRVNFPPTSDTTLNLTGQTTRSLGDLHSRRAGYANVGETFLTNRLSAAMCLSKAICVRNENPRGHDWNTFDQIYPSNHDKFGFAAQVGVGTLWSFSRHRTRPHEKMEDQRGLAKAFWPPLRMTIFTTAAEPCCSPLIPAQADTSQRTRSDR